MREIWTIASTDITSISFSHRVEVIVIDNGSTGESYMIAKKYEPQVKLIKSPHNLGCSAGNNLGIRVAKRKVYIFSKQQYYSLSRLYL